MVEKVAGLLPT